MGLSGHFELELQLMTTSALCLGALAHAVNSMQQITKRVRMESLPVASCSVPEMDEQPTVELPEFWPHEHVLGDRLTVAVLNYDG